VSDKTADIVMQVENERDRIKALAEKALLDLIECQKNDDNESAHMDADSVLVDFLAVLGYSEICEAYEKVGK